MNARPARTAIAALLASTLLFAGCNDGDGGDGDAKSTPLGGSSSDATSDAPTGASTSEGSDDGASGLDKNEFFETIVRAQQDTGSFRSTTTTTAAGMKVVLNSEAVYEDGEFLGHGKSAPGSAQQVETVIASGVLYLKGDGLGIPAGKWVKLDPNDPKNADNPLAGLAAAADPEVALSAMGDLDSLELVGSEKVGGVDASHYRAVMKTETYADALGLPAETAKFLPAKLPFDMWIDEDNRPVKFTVSFDIGGTTSSTEQTYFDYGADLDIVTPKDSDTVPFSSLGIGQG
ncbi:MAG: hypothetical protein NTX33_11325 [Propionibacteriales bacterium]|nr:hypothetical protein [Propionibacteriales bacterium]